MLDTQTYTTLPTAPTRMTFTERKWHDAEGEKLNLISAEFQFPENKYWMMNDEIKWFLQPGSYRI